MSLPARADNEDTRLQLRYGIEERQQRQEGEKVGDLSFGSSAPQEDDNLPTALMKAVNAQNEAETLRLLEIYKAQPDADPDMVLFAEANLAVFRDVCRARWHAIGSCMRAIRSLSAPSSI